MTDGPWNDYAPQAAAQPVAAAAADGPWNDYASQAGAPGPLIPGIGVSQATIDPSIFANADAKESAAYSANPVAAVGNDAAGLASGANSVANAVAHAVPFGNRISAAGDSLPVVGTGKSYSANLANENAETAQGWKDNPGLQLAANAATMAAIPFPAGKIADAATLPSKVGSAMTAGGLTGAVYGASASPDLTNIKQTATDAAEGAAGGAAAGLVAAPVAAGIGAAARGVAGYFRPQIGQLPAAENTLLYRAMSPEGGPAISQNLNNLGPQANLMDASKGALSLGQGVSGNLGLDNAAITQPLASRAAGTNTRLAGDVNAAVGPAPPSAQIASDALTAQKAPFSAAVTQALQTAPPVDISPIIAKIDSIQTADGTPLQSTLATIRRSLTQDAPAQTIPSLPDNPSAQQYQSWLAATNAAPGASRIPVSDAQTLDRARQAIDGMIQYSPQGLGPLAGADAAAQGIVGDLRKQLSESLKTQVPGYAEPIGRLSALNKQQQAILDGSQSLGGGTAAINPNDFSAKYGPAAVGPTQPGMLPPRTPLQQATNTGMRATIDQKLGTSPNDFSALKGLMQGSADPESGIGAGYNSTNIGQAFGPQAETGIQTALNRENSFANTNTKISGNSETAQRQAMADALKQATENKPLIGGHVGDVTTHGLFLAPARAAVNALAAPFQGHVDAPALYRNLSGALTAQGPRAQQMLADALQSGANTAKNAGVGKNAAYLALLAQQLGIGSGVGAYGSGNTPSRQ